MSYVQRVLQPGEEIRYTARVHWIKSLSGLVLLLAAAVVFVVTQYADRGRTFWFSVAVGLAALGVLQILYTWFRRWITEIAVTNRRIIFKTGFVSRDTYEMHMDKVESVKVDQSILGRILDYGDVAVLGTGTGFEPLRSVAAPIELRNHITGV